MDCPICEYRRIAREAINAIADTLLHWALEERDLLKGDSVKLAELREEFRTAYHAEHAAAA